VRATIRPCVVIFLLAVSASASGATRYVTDEFRINLRSGAGNEFRIIERVATGTELELVNSQGDWSQVRMPGGTAGWVRTQYLDSEPAAANRVAGMEKKLSQAQQRVKELEGNLGGTGKQLDTARKRVRELTAARDRLKQKVDEASRGLELSEENRKLKKQVIDLERRVQDLRNETDRLTDRREQDWFLIGAGVIVFGMLLGIIVTRIRWRPRSNWREL